MRRTAVAVTSLVVSLVLAACSGDSTSTPPPRGVVPQAPSRTLLALSCSNNAFSTMTQDAKLYFPAKDPVFDSIPVMKKLFGTSLAAATPTGFNILARTAAVRDGGLEIGPGSAGGKFVLDVVGCMSVGPVDDSFKPDQALNNGVFEVKGSALDNTPATAKIAAAGHGTVGASPLWGTEPNGNWSRSAAANYLVYGYPLGASVLTSGFEMGTIPQSIGRAGSAAGLANLFRVGLCIHAANGTNTAANRLIHANSIVTGLLDPSSTLEQGAQFCAGNVILVNSANSSWLQRFANSARSLLSPKSAFAMQIDNGIGGLPDGWSPIVPNAIPGASIGLAIDTLHNTFADTLFTVVVTATDASGPVPGVSVTLSVDNNNGVPAGAIISAGNPTGTTDINGQVSLTIAVGKAGGFILAANGSISSVPTQTGFSNQFQVQNK